MMSARCQTVSFSTAQIYSDTNAGAGLQNQCHFSPMWQKEKNVQIHTIRQASKFSVLILKSAISVQLQNKECTKRMPWGPQNYLSYNFTGMHAVTFKSQISTLESHVYLQSAK